MKRGEGEEEGKDIEEFKSRRRERRRKEKLGRRRGRKRD
jgi:hypothetical protein